MAETMLSTQESCKSGRPFFEFKLEWQNEFSKKIFHMRKPTCEFIRIIDEVFNRLNAKIPLAKGHKAALSRDNQDKWQEFFKQAKSDLLTLLDNDGTPLHASGRCSHKYGVEEPHAVQLIKMIAHSYVTLRLWKCGKQHHQRVLLKGHSSKRMAYNKIVLFSGL
ncbi:THAP domain-containing protein 9 [Plakobranchus ocellatus]|uniref:THAP domain-containing protein 9 n=1 Tax=Plakobranchus ocellatus TaxID=259542 RepID=A0AAV4A551_9GAST|nr:THAP domain-containing protein 9 [Plakobranchus ocellatus]